MDIMFLARNGKARLFLGTEQTLELAHRNTHSHLPPQNLAVWAGPHEEEEPSTAGARPTPGPGRVIEWSVETHIFTASSHITPTMTDVHW